MKTFRMILFAGLLGGLASVPALADHHMVCGSGCNDCRDDCRPRHRLFGHRRDCGPCEEKVCVPKMEKLKVTKPVYQCKCVDFCLPGHPSRCFTPLSHGCKDDCGPCGHPGCGPHGCRHAGCGHAAARCADDKDCVTCEHKVRTRKVLIKRFKTEEKDVLRCVPETRPCVVVVQECAPQPPACGTIIVQPAPGGKPVELAPMPAEKKK